MIYFLIFLYLLISAIWLEGKKCTNALFVKYNYIVECLVLILLFGLRYRLGSDSIRYENAYDHMPELRYIEFNLFVFVKYQPFWLFLNSLLKSLGCSFVVLQILQSIFVNGGVFYIIQKKCHYKYTAIVFYYLLYYQYFTTEILRESIAVVIFLLSYDSLINKRYLKYMGMAVIAFLFHISSIIIFLAPFFVIFLKKKYNFFTLYIIVVVFSLISSVLIERFVDLFGGLDEYVDSLSDNYLDHSLNIFGMLYKLFFLLPYILFLSIIKYIPSLNNRENRLILLSYIILKVLGVAYPPLDRFSNYFCILMLIVVTNMLRVTTFYKYHCLVFGGFLIVLYSQFAFYLKDYSYYNDNRTAYYYNMFIPYSSIINPKMDQTRENIAWGQEFYLKPTD